MYGCVVRLFMATPHGGPSVLVTEYAAVVYTGSDLKEPAVYKEQSGNHSRELSPGSPESRQEGQSTYQGLEGEEEGEEKGEEEEVEEKFSLDFPEEITDGRPSF